MSWVDCPTCHGSGEIGFNDSPRKDPQCEETAVCGSCHGEGAIWWTAEDIEYERANERWGRDGRGGL